MEGWLNKKGGGGLTFGFSKKYFKLHAYELSYYSSPTDRTPKDTFDLRQCSLVSEGPSPAGASDPGSEFEWLMHVAKKKLQLRAYSAEDKTCWLALLLPFHNAAQAIASRSWPCLPIAPNLSYGLLVCIDALGRDGCVQGIFRESGRAEEVHAIYMGFLRGNDNLPLGSDVHAVAGCLKRMLRELPETLLTNALWPDVVALPQSPAKVSAIVQALPLANREILTALVELLYLIVCHSHVTKMDVKNIAIVLTPNLTRRDQPATVTPLEQFFQVLIMNKDTCLYAGKPPNDVAPPPASSPTTVAAAATAAASSSSAASAASAAAAPKAGAGGTTTAAKPPIAKPAPLLVPSTSERQMAGATPHAPPSPSTAMTPATRSLNSAARSPSMDASLSAKSVRGGASTSAAAGRGPAASPDASQAEGDDSIFPDDDSMAEMERAAVTGPAASPAAGSANAAASKPPLALPTKAAGPALPPKLAAASAPARAVGAPAPRGAAIPASSAAASSKPPLPRSGSLAAPAPSAAAFDSASDDDEDENSEAAARAARHLASRRIPGRGGAANKKKVDSDDDLDFDDKPLTPKEKNRTVAPAAAAAAPAAAAAVNAVASTVPAAAAAAPAAQAAAPAKPASTAAPRSPASPPSKAVATGTLDLSLAGDEGTLNFDSPSPAKRKPLSPAERKTVAPSAAAAAAATVAPLPAAVSAVPAPASPPAKVAPTATGAQHDSVLNSSFEDDDALSLASALPPKKATVAAAAPSAAASKAALTPASPPAPVPARVTADPTDHSLTFGDDTTDLELTDDASMHEHIFEAAAKQPSAAAAAKPSTRPTPVRASTPPRKGHAGPPLSAVKEAPGGPFGDEDGTDESDPSAAAPMPVMASVDLDASLNLDDSSDGTHPAMAAAAGDSKESRQRALIAAAAAKQRAASKARAGADSPDAKQPAVKPMAAAPPAKKPAAAVAPHDSLLEDDPSLFSAIGGGVGADSTLNLLDDSEAPAPAPAPVRPTLKLPVAASPASIVAVPVTTAAASVELEDPTNFSLDLDSQLHSPIANTSKKSPATRSPAAAAASTSKTASSAAKPPPSPKRAVSAASAGLASPKRAVAAAASSPRAASDSAELARLTREVRRLELETLALQSQLAKASDASTAALARAEDAEKRARALDAAASEDTKRAFERAEKAAAEAGAKAAQRHAAQIALLTQRAEAAEAQSLSHLAAKDQAARAAIDANDTAADLRLQLQNAQSTLRSVESERTYATQQLAQRDTIAAEKRSQLLAAQARIEALEREAAQAHLSRVEESARAASELGNRTDALRRVTSEREQLHLALQVETRRADGTDKELADLRAAIANGSSSANSAAALSLRAERDRDLKLMEADRASWLVTRAALETQLADAEARYKALLGRHTDLDASHAAVQAKLERADLQALSKAHKISYLQRALDAVELDSTRRMRVAFGVLAQQSLALESAAERMQQAEALVQRHTAVEVYDRMLHDREQATADLADRLSALSQAQSLVAPDAATPATASVPAPILASLMDQYPALRGIVAGPILAPSANGTIGAVSVDGSPLPTHREQGPAAAVREDRPVYQSLVGRTGPPSLSSFRSSLEFIPLINWSSSSSNGASTARRPPRKLLDAEDDEKHSARGVAAAPLSPGRTTAVGSPLSSPRDASRSWQPFHLSSASAADAASRSVARAPASTAFLPRSAASTTSFDENRRLLMQIEAKTRAGLDASHARVQDLDETIAAVQYQQQQQNRHKSRG